jgi:hypothetical protein
MWFFGKIFDGLRLVNLKLEKIMAQIDDLNAALAKATTDTQTLISGVAAEVASLQAQLAALQSANPAVDLTAAIASVNNIDSLVSAATPVAGGAATKGA